MTTRLAAALSLALVAIGSPCQAATKPKPKPHAPYTKGQSQIAGGNGRFGVVYSLKDGWNEELLSAKYTVDPFVGYEYAFPGPNQKLLVVDFAIKNALPDSLFYNLGSRYDAFDQHGNKFECIEAELASNSDKEFGPTLNPGQGLGQPSMNDPLRMVFLVNADSMIRKITINQGRKGTSEDIVRYFMAGATKAADGDNGDPANTIAPLPDSVRDPADPSGATAVDPGFAGKPGTGVFYPSRVFGYNLASVDDAPDGMQYSGNGPDDGKKYVTATLTVKCLVPQPQPYFDATGDSTIQLTDADGQTYAAIARLSKSHDVDYEGDKIAPSTPVTIRCLFMVPKDVVLKTFTTGATGARMWNWDISK